LGTSTSRQIPALFLEKKMKQADKQKLSVPVLTVLIALFAAAVVVWVIFNLPPRVPTYERDGVPERETAASQSSGQ
jgi:hypothetical protein